MPGTIVEPFHDDAGDMNDGSERGEEGGDKESEARLMNVAYFIGDDGSILGRYEKKNLWVYICLSIYCYLSDSTSFLQPFF